ncbi:TerB family tellurite resistance protein [Candidatus Pelagibacter sp.]|nr:TerB family tellurite resistance protein [Candidatus Pelagibacter sp.]|tara:strand:+ start:1107 stop:1520 length:414 start_codon:yes stop_codon:yes gene_type:complete
MIFFKNRNDKEQITNFVKIAALLIHAAKIDENYSIEEEKIIKKTLLNLGVEKGKLNTLVEEAKNIEAQSNHILDFTKEFKNLDEKEKINIVKSLWRIIYSNKDADIYETNLMRRLAGLLYIDSKIMGDIKEQIKKEF